VVAVVHARGGEERPVFGLSLADRLWWSPVDLFRVVDGRVAERTGAGGRPALLESLVQTPVTPAVPTPLMVTGVHVTVEPDGWYRAPAIDGLRVLVVETGALDVMVAATDAFAGMTGSYHAILGAGERLVLTDGPTGSAYEAHNVGSDSAVFIEVQATPGVTGPSPVHRTVEGPGTRESAGAPTAQGTAGAKELTIGRATLSPGGRLTWTGAANPVLLWVERGTLDLRTDATAFAWVQRQPAAPPGDRRSTTLSTGDDGLVDAGTAVEIRNAGDEPLEVLIVTLVGPPKETATPAASLPPLPPIPGLVLVRR
jgi:hypothetical protein